MLRGFVGTVDLHNLDGVARGNLHDVTALGAGQSLGKLAREGREGKHAHLAAVGSRCVIDRVARSQLGKVGTAAQHAHEAVGQRLLRIGKHDVLDAQRIGRRLDVEHAGHRPLVVLQHGTVLLAGGQRLGLVVGKLGCRDVVLGDAAVAVAAYEGAHLVGGCQLGTHLLGLLLQREHVVIGGVHLEDDVGERARRLLLEHLLVALVIFVHLRRADREERIGHRSVLLAGPTTREGVVRRSNAVGHLQSVHIGAAANQTHILLEETLETRLLVERLPCGLRLGVGLGLGKELTYGRHVVAARTGVGEGVEEGLRGLLAAHHGHTLGLRHAKAEALEARVEHILREELLPGCVGQHGRLLLVGIDGAALRTHALVGLVILRIVDFLAVDDAHAGVIAREAHLGLQRQDECQEGECDDNRKHDAELGP